MNPDPQPTPEPFTTRLYRCSDCRFERNVTAQEHYPIGCCRTNCNGRSEPVQPTPVPDWEILEYLFSLFDKYGTVSLQKWDHDGRRQQGSAIFVHKFKERGGEDETYRQAITAAIQAQPK